MYWCVFLFYFRRYFRCAFEGSQCIRKIAKRIPLLMLFFVPRYYLGNNIEGRGFSWKALEKIIPLLALQDVILDDCFRIWGILRNWKKKKMSHNAATLSLSLSRFLITRLGNVVSLSFLLTCSDNRIILFASRVHHQTDEKLQNPTAVGPDCWIPLDSRKLIIDWFDSQSN